MSAANRRRNRSAATPDGRAFRSDRARRALPRPGSRGVEPGHPSELGVERDAAGQCSADLGGVGRLAVLSRALHRELSGGLALAIVGIGLLLGGSFSLSIDHAVGDMLGAVAGALWGAYIMTIGRLRGRVPIATIMFWGSLVSMPGLARGGAAAGEELWPHSGNGWLDLLVWRSVCQGRRQSMVAWALAHLPSSFAAVALLVNPVSATILAWAILQRARRSPADRRRHHRADRHPAGARPAAAEARTLRPRPVANTVA